MFNERKFRAQMVLQGVNMKTLASELDINEATLYRKIKDNGAFTRNEINKMIVFLQITDPKDIFFAEELADTQE